MRFGAILVAALCLAYCATTIQPPATAGQASDVPIQSVKDIAGKWAGTVKIGSNPPGPVSIDIREDGSYTGQSPRGAITGNMWMEGEALHSKSNNGTAIWTLTIKDGKRTLRSVGAQGGGNSPK
jgi:hypothetical protein